MSQGPIAQTPEKKNENKNLIQGTIRSNDFEKMKNALWKMFLARKMKNEATGYFNKAAEFII